MASLYEVTTTTAFFSKNAVNVYFYDPDSTFSDFGTSVGLATDFDIVMTPLILGMMVDDWALKRISVRNLFDATDTFDLQKTGAVGTLAAGQDSLPPANATSFKLTGVTAITRPGGKRIPGLAEVSQTDGIITMAGLIIANDAFAAGMTAGIPATESGIATWAPVIVKRIVEGGPPPLPVTYRLPDNVGEADVNAISQVGWNGFISTQVGRKIRRAD